MVVRGGCGCDCVGAVIVVACMVGVGVAFGFVLRVWWWLCEACVVVCVRLCWLTLGVPVVIVLAL